MNQVDNLTSDDGKPGKSGQLKMPIVCVICNNERGVVTLDYVSDKDKGLFRALCICENCKDTDHAKQLIKENENKSIGVVDNKPFRGKF